MHCLLPARWSVSSEWWVFKICFDLWSILNVLEVHSNFLRASFSTPYSSTCWNVDRTVCQRCANLLPNRPDARLLSYPKTLWLGAVSEPPKKTPDCFFCLKCLEKVHFFPLFITSLDKTGLLNLSKSASLLWGSCFEIRRVRVSSECLVYWKLNCEFNSSKVCHA